LTRQHLLLTYFSCSTLAPHLLGSLLPPSLPPSPCLSLPLSLLPSAPKRLNAPSTRARTHSLSPPHTHTRTLSHTQKARARMRFSGLPFAPSLSLPHFSFFLLSFLAGMVVVVVVSVVHVCTAGKAKDVLERPKIPTKGGRRAERRRGAAQLQYPAGYPRNPKKWILSLHFLRTKKRQQTRLYCL